MQFHKLLMLKVYRFLSLFIRTRVLPSLSTVWRKIPHKAHWAFVALSGCIVPLLTLKTAKPGEWYPFSNFPMYSSFDTHAYYVYVTDLEHRPVALYPVFGTWTSSVKKIYDGHLKAEARRLGKASRHMTLEECRGPALATLRQLRSTSRYPEAVAQYDGFRLHRVYITLDDDGRIQQQTSLLATQ